uniref:Uncharacterized protein n=1 Tax=Globodera pallida TaxID=36090 RepID=A0A183CPT6_GLOPA
MLTRFKPPIYWTDILEVDFGAQPHFIPADNVYEAFNKASNGAKADQNQNHVKEIDYRPGNRYAILLMDSTEAAL